MTSPLLTAPAADRRVRYVAAGRPDASRVLVLVHAFPLGVGMWEPQLAATADPSAPFGADWRMLAVALPGFDGSDLPAAESMHAYARDVLAVLDQERVATASLCGLSLGGYVAFELLRQAAERIDRVVLADTRAGADSEQAAAGRRRTLELVSAGGTTAIADDMLPKLLGRTSQSRRPELAVRLRELVTAQPPDAIAAATRAMLARPDSTPLLATLRMPTLVLVGEEDTLTPPGEAGRMHAAIPHASYVQIPEAGHMTNMENPRVFNEVMAEFFRE